MTAAGILRMDDYTAKAKAYWWVTALLGAATLAWAVGTVARMEPSTIFQVMLGSVFAAVTGLFPVRIPGAKTSASVAEVFIFLLLLDFGPAAAVIAAAAEGSVISWRTSDRWTSRFGSPAMASIAMLVCGGAFTEAYAQLVAMGIFGVGLKFSLLLALALSYFSVHTLLIASLFSLKRDEPIRPIAILREHAWLALLYAGSGSIAGMLHTSFGGFEFSVLSAAAPLIAAVLALLHVYFRHAEAEAGIQAERIRAAEMAAAESARHLAELRESEDRFQSAFTHAAVGMTLVSTEGTIVQANAAMGRLLGRSVDEFSGTDLMHWINPDDQEALYAQMRSLVIGNESTFSAELRCRHNQGIDVWVSMNGSFFQAKPPLSRCLILQLQDITARRRAESRLQYIAYHDGLTDLPNRTHFVEQLTRVIAVVRRHPERRFAVLILDFDRFKLVNDSLGHSAGDQLLVELARRLQGYLRPSDLLARLGGDEFAILVEDINADVEAVRIAERVKDVLAEPVYLKGVAVSTSASIGITTSTFGYDVPEQVMRDADTAMYRAKSQTQGAYVVFDSALHADVTARLWLENELRRAISNSQIHLHYQPIYELKSHRLTGFEALARWSHPERGIIPTEKFIRVAEETGQIIPLGTWALETACRQLGAWHAMYPSAPLVSMNVNVSGVQLVQPDFPARVKQAIRMANIQPSQLVIELTESVLVEKLAIALPHLETLRAYGVQISIDDFGTGYSSFSMLGKLPIHIIKIDGSFVAGIGRDPNGEAIVAGILALGRTLDKIMVAEGIETEAQLQRLKDLDCHRGQGYLLAMPAPPEVVEGVFRDASVIANAAGDVSVRAA